MILQKCSRETGYTGILVINYLLRLGYKDIGRRVEVVNHDGAFQQRSTRSWAKGRRAEVVCLLASKHCRALGKSIILLKRSTIPDVFWEWSAESWAKGRRAVTVRGADCMSGDEQTLWRAWQVDNFVGSFASGKGARGTG